MRHVAFALAVGLYVLAGGQNWTTYAAAVMVAAWIQHHRPERSSP